MTQHGDHNHQRQGRGDRRRDRRASRRWRWLAAVVAFVLVLGVAAGGLAVYAPFTLVNLPVSTAGLTIVPDLAYGEAPRQRLTVYAPRGPLPEQAGDRGRPVVVYLYGGGWRAGERDDYLFMGAALADAGYVVVIPDYRLHPEVEYPAFLEDNAAAVAWTVDNIRRYGGDPDRLALMGHSAGAYNAVMVTLDPRYLAAHGLSPDRIDGVVGLAGPYDFLPADFASTRDVFGEHRRSPETQPLRHVTADAPPMLLLHGLADDTTSPRHAPALAEALEAAGAEARYAQYPGMTHAGIVAAFVPVWRQLQPVRADVLAFLGEVLP